MGTASSWSDVQEFKAVLSPISTTERVAFAKETVFATYRLLISGSEITLENRSEIKEKNRVEIGIIKYDIKAAINYHNRHWELDLMEVA